MIKRLKWPFRIVALLILIGGLSIMVGCVRNSGGVWYFREAKTPEGWPDLTPVGEIQVKTYPGYREAIVDDAEGQPNNSGAFGVLFQHIKNNDIAMTAPVDVTYDPATDSPRMRSMSFLYDTPERGPVGEDGKVTVRDVPPTTTLSIGVRGGYSDTNFQKNVTRLEQWLADQTDYHPAGPPRLLGYNSPLVPPFWKYAEVQIPIKPTND
jgi:hypothetical protein